MGDRVIFVCHDKGGDIAPAIYGHWQGSDALELLGKAASVMRKDDPSYAAARLCGVIHSQRPDRRTGLGLIHPPTDCNPDTLARFSHGDAGVIAIDVSDGSWACYGGYLSREPDEGEQRPACPNPLVLGD